MKKSSPIILATIVLLSCAFYVFAPARQARGEEEAATDSVQRTADSGQLSLPATAGKPAEIGSTIGSIQISGNKSITTTAILSKIRSRVGESFDPATAAEDAKRIAELAGAEYSYYNTAVVDNKIQLTFVVAEKTIARSIAFVGNEKYNSKTLEKKLDFKVGDYVDLIGAQSGAKALIDFYHRNGLPFAQVTLDDEKLSLGKVSYTIDEGPMVKIGAVKLVGNKSVKTNVLKKAVKSKKKFLLWTRYYVEESLAEDVTKLQSIYYDRGFLNTNITTKQDFSKDRSKAYVTFVIDEGPAFTIEKITIAGNKHFDEKQLQPKLKSQKGRVYIVRKADSDAKELLRVYREAGFIDVRVEHSRQFVSSNSVSMEFAVTEGERFRIGQINITGNEQTQDKVVRRILDEYDFQPGQWYNADMARGDGGGELEKTIKSMAMTEAATITPSGEKPGQRDAQVNIIEGQTGMVMVGAGIGSDSGIIGQMLFEQKNFDIKDKPESFGEFITGQAYKGAGQDLRISLEPGTEYSEYSVSFTEPYFRNKPVSLNVIGSSYERWFESYNEKRLRSFVEFERRYKSRWTKSIGFRLENVDVASLDDDAPKEIKDVKGGNALAGVEFGIGKNLTDNRFNPTRGYSFHTSYEQVGGDHTFGVLSGTYRHYKTIYEDLAERKTILATRLQAATTVGNAPPFEKFYAGGSTSIRGFDYRGVSTRGLQTNVDNPERKDPIGSDWLFLASTEATVPLVSDNLAALFFIDSGAIDSGNYRAAIGIGVQITIPQWFGPVPMRFELAAPIMKDAEDQTQVFSFSMGRLF